MRIPNFAAKWDRNVVNLGTQYLQLKSEVGALLWDEAFKPVESGANSR